MSELIEARIPESLSARLSSCIPEQEAVPLVTLDQEGYPHVALLSYLELFLRDRELYFFLSRRSRSTKNLQHRSSCTLLFLSANNVFYLKGRAKFVFVYKSQAVFHLELTSVLQDFPQRSEGSGGLLSGLRFGLEPEHLRHKLSIRQGIQDALSQQ